MFSFPWKKVASALYLQMPLLLPLIISCADITVYLVGPYIEQSCLYHSPLQLSEVGNRIFEHSITDTVHHGYTVYGSIFCFAFCSFSSNS